MHLSSNEYSEKRGVFLGATRKLGRGVTPAKHAQFRNKHIRGTATTAS
jgi:hypothetical protein